MSFTYDDQDCPARGPGLTHMPEHRGGRCEFCGARVYSSERRDRAAATPSSAPTAGQRLAAYAWQARRRIELEGPDPLDRLMPSNAVPREPR